jgi:hypothetical protein
VITLPLLPNDTTTQLSRGAQDGDKMDESLVAQPTDGTQAKRPRVVVGDDDGNLFGARNPMPVVDRAQRDANERSILSSQSKLDVNLTTRHRERVRWGDRLDLIDHRGPGGR